MMIRCSVRYMIALVVIACSATHSIASDSAKLREKGISVADLLEKAREGTGEKLWANEAAAGEKVAVLIGPKDVRKALDLLPGHQWVSGRLPNGTSFYVLGPDWEERDRWSKLAQEVLDRHEEGMADIGRKRIRTYIKALKYSKEQLDAMIADDPQLVRELSDPTTRSMVEFISERPQSEWEQAITGGHKLELKFAELPSDLQERLIADSRAEQEWSTALTSEHERPTNGPTADELESAIRANARLVLSGYGFDGGLSFGIRAVGEHAELYPFIFHEVMRPSYYFAEYARAPLWIERGMPADKAEKLQKERAEADNKRWAEAEKSVVEARLRDFPPRFGSGKAPDIKLSAAATAKQFYDSVLSICEKEDLSLICQYFDKCDKASFSVELPEGTPVGPAFDRILDKLPDQHCTPVWACKDGLVVAGTRDMVEDLSIEIPEDLLAKWRDRAKLQGGFLSLDDLVEIATTLTDKQMTSGKLPRDFWRIGAGMLIFNKHALRFYASLDANQRKKARQSSISYPSLTPAQKRLFDIAASANLTDNKLPDEATPESFSIKQGEQRGNRSQLDFTFSVKGIAPVVFSVLVSVLPAPAATSGTPTKRPAIPAEPRALSVAARLANWNYVSRQTREGEDVRATLRNNAGEEVKKRTLAVGSVLEGAKLTDINAEFLTFIVEGSKLVIPARCAVSLAPYKVECGIDPSSMLGVNAIMTGEK